MIIKSKKLTVTLLTIVFAVALLLGIAAFGVGAQNTAYASGNAPSGDFITFSSANSFTITVPKYWDGTLEYSSDDTTWTVYDGGDLLNAVQIGGTGDYYLCFRGKNNTKVASWEGAWTINGTAVSCSGNMETLLDYTTVANNEHPTMVEYCFYKMFENCTALIKAPELPSTTLPAYSYGKMFAGCTSLTTAPALPATTLAELCYYDMFKGCTELTSAPALPATTLANNCYANMFSGCTKLTTAPALPATTLANNCYSDMFNGCTKLTSAPVLPATTLARSCYNNMFDGCTALTTAPELPATALADFCYYYMFAGCTALTSAPVLPATTLTNKCYRSMFSNCSALTSVPSLPATTLAEDCYSYMFTYCTSLTAAPKLPATDLADYCYYSMFGECVALTAAPELPATTLAVRCYSSMFYNCKALTLAPALPATTLAEYCYSSMFSRCSSLAAAPRLPATNLAEYCYSGMFSYCTALVSLPDLPATTLADYCYSDMFSNCSEIKLNTSSGTAWSVQGATATTGWNTDMFKNTGGFTGNPDINTTYYLTLPKAVVVFDADGSNATVTRYDSISAAWTAAAALNTTSAYRATVTLFDNWTATAGSFGTGDGFFNGAINVPSGKYITLDLNGYSIDRALTVAIVNGYIIYVNGGSFELTDSSADKTGVLTGGNNTSNGGGVYVNSGSFTMTGGKIEGNTARVGGGVYVYSGSFTMTGGEILGNNVSGFGGGGVYLLEGTFTMSGGSITGNNTVGNYGGGVRIYGTLILSGDATIADNCYGGTKTNGETVYTGGTANNVWLDGNKIITVSATFTGTIGVTTENLPTGGNPVTLTSGWGGSTGTITSDNAEYAVIANGTEKVLSLMPYTVTFKSNYEGGIDDITQTVEKNVATNLDANAFTREGYSFAGWAIDQNGTKAYDDQGTVTLAANLDLYALWTIEGYTLAFNSNGGSTESDITKNFGEAINLPTPTKVGYKFEGWFDGVTDGNGSGTQFASATMPDVGANGTTKNLYAKWTIKNYSITVNATNVDYIIYDGSGREFNSVNNATINDYFKIRLNKIRSYDIPVTYSVTVGGVEMTTDTFNNSTYAYTWAEVWFNSGEIVGNVVVTVAGTLGNTYWHDEGVRATGFSTYDSAANTLTIMNAQELGLFIYAYNENRSLLPSFADREKLKILIGADIDLSGYKWLPFDAPYAIFDGQGYTIKSIDIDVGIDGKRYFGFFANANGSKGIQNLTLQGKIEGDCKSGDVYIGGLFGYAENSYEFINIGTDMDINVKLLNGGNVGGLAGYYKADEPKCFTNCYAVGDIAVDANNSTGVVRIGGLIGTIKGEKITNSYFGGTITITNAANNTSKGTLVGYSNGSTVEYCYALNNESYSLFGVAIYYYTPTENINLALTAANMTAASGDDALISLLNSWVKTTANSKYCVWKIIDGENGGMPVLYDFYATGIITLAVGGHGSFATTPAAISYDNLTADAPTLTAPTANSGWNFAGWLITSVSDGSTWTNNADYAWAAYSHGDITLTAQYTAKTAVSVDNNVQSGIDYSGSAIVFALTGTHKDIGSFKIEYFVDSDWTETAPTNAGSYNVRVSRLEDDTYAAYSPAVITGGLVINKIVLTPSVGGIDGKTYDGNTTATGTISLSGAVNSEEPTASGTFVWTSANAETNTFNVTNIALGEGWTTNYQLSATSLDSQTFGSAKISKAYYVMTGAAWNYSDPFIYDGNAKTVEVVDLPSGVTVNEYTDNSKTDAGTYTASVTFNFDTTNYNTPILADCVWTINQADNGFTTVVAIMGWTYGGNANSPTSAAKFGTPTYTYSDSENGTYTTAVPTTAGTHWVKASVAETTNYASVESKISFAIATQKVTKPTVDSTVFIADGTNKTYAITADNRYTVSGNVKSDFGSYTVTVALNDTSNYEWTDGTTINLNFDFVIRQPQLAEKTDAAAEKDDVIVTTENGFAPDVTVSITVVEQTEVTNVSSNVAENEDVVLVYDVKLLVGGEISQPEGIITIKILIPTECAGKSFRILHVHNETVTEMQYTVDGDYAVVTTDRLSEFVFIADKDAFSLVWLIILLAIIILAEVSLAVYKLRKDKKSKNTVKTYSFMPLLLAALIPAGQIETVIAFGVVAVLGGVFDAYLYLLKDKMTKRDEIAAMCDEESETLSVEEGVSETATIETQPTVETNISAAEKILVDEIAATAEYDEEETEIFKGVEKETGLAVLVRYRKAFTARLIQAPDETKRYYSELKNALLSYKKTTSRISWNYDSINSGRTKLAKLNIRGKTLYLYLALNPDDYADTKYKVEKSTSQKYEETPCLYKIKNERRAKYAVELIAVLAKMFGLVLGDTQTSDYYLPFDTTENLIKRELIKELISKEKYEDYMQKQQHSEMGLKKRIFVTADEADNLLGDAAAMRKITILKTDVITNKMRGIVNIDSISEQFSENETVDINSLKEKHLLARSVNYYKILARGTLNKPLTVKANEFSIEAVKMILLTGGKVIKLT